MLDVGQLIMVALCIFMLIALFVDRKDQYWWVTALWVLNTLIWVLI